MILSRSFSGPAASRPGDGQTPWLLAAFFLGVVLLGSLLAPWLWWGGQWLAAQAWMPAGGSLHNGLGSEFDRYFRRAVLVATLLLIGPLWRRLRVRRSDWWLPARRGGWKELLLGFFLALGVLLLLGWAELAAGAYRWKAGHGLDWAELPTALLAGLAVGGLEEFVFRALLFGLLLRSMPTTRAAVVLTLLFALLHFFVPPERLMLVPEGHAKLARGGQSDLPGGQMQWWSGFWLTGLTLGNVTDAHWWTLVLAEFGTLLAVGAALVVARIRTGALWLGIGLHAGWVTGLKWFAASTAGSPSLKRDEWLPWIGENLKVGLFPLLVVLATGALALALAPLLGARSADGTGSRRAS